MPRELQREHFTSGKEIDMTDADQNIAVAEALGWKWYWRVCGREPDESFAWCLHFSLPPEEGIGKAWIGCAGETRAATQKEISDALASRNFFRDYPDYGSDLNAIHEAEKTLEPDSRRVFISRLFDCALRGREGLCPDDETYLCLHATAPQRREAFLRTKGLWKE